MPPAPGNRLPAERRPNKLHRVNSRLVVVVVADGARAASGATAAACECCCETPPLLLLLLWDSAVKADCNRCLRPPDAALCASRAHSSSDRITRSTTACAPMRSVLCLLLMLLRLLCTHGLIPFSSPEGCAVVGLAVVGCSSVVAVVLVGAAAAAAVACRFQECGAAPACRMYLAQLLPIMLLDASWASSCACCCVLVVCAGVLAEGTRAKDTTPDARQLLAVVLLKLPPQTSAAGAACLNGAKG